MRQRTFKAHVLKDGGRKLQVTRVKFGPHGLVRNLYFWLQYCSTVGRDTRGLLPSVETITCI